MLTPLRQIAGEQGAMISGKALESNSYDHGFDAQTAEYKDPPAQASSTSRK